MIGIGLIHEYLPIYLADNRYLLSIIGINRYFLNNRYRYWYGLKLDNRYRYRSNLWAFTDVFIGNNR